MFLGRHFCFFNNNAAEKKGLSLNFFRRIIEIRNQKRILSSVGISIGQDRRVCESTYLKVIGLGQTNMWRRTKAKVQKIVENGEFESFNNKGGFIIDEVLQAIRQTKAPSEQKSRHQSE